MSELKKPVINIDEVKMFEMSHGNGFAAKLGRIGPLIGSGGVGCMLTIVPPGKKAFPFHNHHVINELFYILSGTGEYRFGGQTYPIKMGDILSAPAGGPDVAHQIINTGKTELKYLGISDKAKDDAEIVEYPDSGKFAVMSQTKDGSPMTARLRFVGRLESSIDYWDGEK
jgi:uncharacterized cupin superfamily protein